MCGDTSFDPSRGCDAALLLAKGRQLDIANRKMNERAGGKARRATPCVGGIGFSKIMCHIIRMIFVLYAIQTMLLQKWMHHVKLERI